MIGLVDVMEPGVLPRQCPLVVRSAGEVERYLDIIRQSAGRLQVWIAQQRGDPLDLLRQLKFAAVGFHPIEDRVLNAIEQVNQTWSYVVALAATRELLKRHPEAEGYRVAPGAHMATPLDIMSLRAGVVGAEVFAAVHPNNNRKLRSDLEKLAARQEKHRYILRRLGLQRPSGDQRSSAATISRCGR